MSYSYLSATEKARLAGVPFAVVLPQMLPDGWRFDSITEFCDEDSQDFSLEVTFSGPALAKCTVASTNGGLGDILIEAEDVVKEVFESSRWGRVILYRFDDGVQVLSDWFPEDEGSAAYYSLRGSSITSDDLQSLILSLIPYSCT